MRSFRELGHLQDESQVLIAMVEGKLNPELESLVWFDWCSEINALRLML